VPFSPQPAKVILTEHERQRLGTLQRGRAAGRRGGRPTARAVPPSPAAPAPVAPRPGRRPELSSASPELRQKRATRGAATPPPGTTNARERLKRARARTLPLLTATATYLSPLAASRRILPATAALLPPLDVPLLVGCRPSLPERTLSVVSSENNLRSTASPGTRTHIGAHSDMQDAAQKPGPTLRAEPVTHEAFAPYGDRTSRLLAELF
jgi:hypothetical protein